MPEEEAHAHSKNALHSQSPPVLQSLSSPRSLPTSPESLHISLSISKSLQSKPHRPNLCPLHQIRSPSRPLPCHHYHLPFLQARRLVSCSAIPFRHSIPRYCLLQRSHCGVRSFCPTQTRFRALRLVEACGSET